MIRRPPRSTPSNSSAASDVYKRQNEGSVSKRGGQKKRKQIMKKNANEKIMMLQYRIKRYQAMGNGAMCQTLNGKLQKLLTKQPAM